MQTLETINVQGVVDELIQDYNAEKERLKLEEGEESQGGKGCSKEAAERDIPRTD